MKPQIWFNAASATIYRNEWERTNTEREGIIGTGFSVDVCKKWEAMFYSFAIEGVRRLNLRIAIVLGKNKSVMIPFVNLTRWGLGGAAGSGKQKFSWIHIEDFCAAISYLMENDTSEGTYNLSAPTPTTNAEFIKALRKEMRMPIGIPQPEWMLKMGAFLIGTETELILKSRWVIPQRLNEEGFKFKHETIATAMANLV